MTGRVAALLADPGQAHVEVEAAARESKPATVKAIRALAQKASVPNHEALKFTIEDLKTFKVQRLHQARTCKSVEWALDEKLPTDENTPALRHKLQAYRKALDNILGLKVKGGARGKKKVPTNILNIFKEKSSGMGVKFEEGKIGDIAQMLAAVKARATEQEE